MADSRWARRKRVTAGDRTLARYIGSSFESFLDEKGIKDEVELRAQKKLRAEQIREAIERKG